VERERACLGTTKPTFINAEGKYKDGLKNMSENTLARIFFHDFQFLQPLKGRRVWLIPENERLLIHLRRLDSLMPRTSLRIPLLYVKDSEATSYEVNNLTDPYFNGFLGSLGLKLDSTHIRTGCFDHLHELISNYGIIYAAQCLAELVFLTPSMKFAGSAAVNCVSPFRTSNKCSLTPQSLSSGMLECTTSTIADFPAS
jgi:hypothetical protein